MKNRIITNSIRTIKNSSSRFIPLIIMSFLGVFVFAGLQETKPSMLKTLDNYLDKYNTYDVKIVSTMGLTDYDIQSLKQVENVKDLEGVNYIDTIIYDDKEEYVLNVSSLPKRVNNLNLIEGKFPDKEDEIVVEKNFLTKTSYKIGDVLEIVDDNLNYSQYKIVGTVESPLYFNSVGVSQQRGNSSIGSGKVNFYSYILKDNFNQDYYTSVYLTIDGAKDKISSSKEYEELVKLTVSKIEQIKSIQEQQRYESIYNKAKKEIDQYEKEANEKLNSVKDTLDKSKTELDYTQLQLNNNKFKLDNIKKELQTARTNLDASKIEYQNTLKMYNINESKIKDNIDILKENIQNIEEIIKNIQEDSSDYLIYKQQLLELQNQLALLEKIDNARSIIENSERQYQDSKNQYDNAYSAYLTGLSAYNQGLSNYNEGLKAYNQSKEEVTIKITEAKEELDNIEKPIWYINNRMEDSTYSDYINDTQSINNLSKIFPIVFFAVAILVSLISINRMVEDDRIEIGTLKSLGFSNHSIMLKYLLFSGIATLFGGIIGLISGAYIIPIIIFNIYSLLFTIPNFSISLDTHIILISLLIIFICVCGTTIFTVSKVLKEKPSELMRPKSPKTGKKIFLENIKLIWNNLDFSHKVTIRNLFRYKKRGLVTVVGIVGCSALMLCGFGIRDAIIDIANIQYNEIFKFDAMAYVSNLTEDSLESFLENPKITEIVEMQNISSKVNDINVYMSIVNDNTDISKVINLIDSNTKEPLTLEKGKVIITDKLSDLTNLKVGDTIEILDSNNKTYKYEISGITENHLEHFIYMDKETFTNQKEEYTPNVLYINTIELNEEESNELSKELIANDEIINVSFTNSLIDNASDMLKSLNKVVIILILLAASLSFVVLYNLSNINIQERKREISTLKVLGFYDKEVDNYVIKENVIFTIIGIIIGLFLGFFLTKVVISTVEIEKARFLHDISFGSYIATAVISFIFTLIVNKVNHIKLKKIDMISSLKSIE